MFRRIALENLREWALKAERKPLRFALHARWVKHACRNV